MTTLQTSINNSSYRKASALSAKTGKKYAGKHLFGSFIMLVLALLFAGQTSWGQAPAITLGTNPAVCFGSTSANLSYSAPTNSPNQYRIDFDATAEGQGFADIGYISLPATPIVITVPGTATAGIYNAVLKVKNTTSGLESIDYNITVTINALPVVTAITGNFTVCVGQQTQLGDATPGGTTTSRNPAIASVNTTGLVTGVSPGSVIIDYTVIDGTTGCTTVVSATITVNAIPTVAAITGNFIACMGSPNQLANATAGGVWGSNNPAAATINSSGLVTPVAQGVTTISYAVTSSGCTNTVLENVYVFNLPVVEAITGNFVICVGGTTQLSSETHDGVLSSHNPAVATVSALGLVTGISAGTAIIDYTVTANGCSTTVSATITVNPVPAAVAGTDRAICTGASTTIGAAAVSGSTYAWTSSPAGFTSTAANPTVSPTVTTVYSVTETITATGCTNTHSVTVTVNALPAAAAGTDRAICTGTSTTIGSAAVPGSTYAWSSSPAGFSSTSANPTVSPTATTTYILVETITATGCTNTHSVIVTVNALPSVPTITGTASFCAGASTTLTSSASVGYQWNLDGSPISGQTASTLIVTAGGSYTVTITNANGCSATSVATGVTVNPLPTVAAIGGGAAAVCVNALTPAFTDATALGVWSIVPGTGTASITTGGVVTGLTAGTVTVTYTVTNGNGCINFVTASLLINPLPTVGPITGTFTLCSGTTTQLGNETPDGILVSTNPAVATVSNTGLVTALTAGTTTINYTVVNGSGCSTTVSADITVNQTPVVAAITGTLTACVGATTQLADVTAAGTWSSTNTAVATVSAAGLVSGLTPGITTINYTVTIAGCTTIVSANVTVFALPVVAGITGTLDVCVGATTQLLDATPGGETTSRNPAIASVNTTGLVTGVAPGSAIIDYTVTINGCSTIVSATVTVHALPSAVAGTDRAICTGASTTIGAAAVSGSTYAWTSLPAGFTSTAANPTVSPTVTTVYSVTETITATGCTNTHSVTVTVNALPAAAAGTDRAICTGTSTTIGSAAVPGSTYAWSSSPAGFSSTSANPTVSPTAATVYSVTETITATGCINTNTVTVTVNPLPVAAAGASRTICSATPATLGAAAVAGSTYAWTSLPSGFTSTEANPTVSPTVTTVYSVTETITATGCTKTNTVTITVNPLPTVAAIGGGAAAVCVNALTPAFTDATALGVWSIVPGTGTASITTGGVVTGLAAGTVTVTYTVTNGNGCINFVTASLLINPLPTVGPITGTFTLCSGTTTQLGNETPDGILVSTNPAVATVSNTGLVTALTAGTTTINYTVVNGSGCSTTVSADITVNQTPVVAAITGTLTACVGATTQLADVTAAGTWSSTNTAVATVSAAGLVSGLTPGITTINYTVTIAGCTTIVSANVTVFALPVVAGITGTLDVCVGATTQLLDATPGGETTSRNPAIASVNTTGLVTGVAPGSAIIDYTVTINGCSTIVSATVTVHALPSAVAGTDRAICTGASTTIGAAAVSGSTYAWTSLPAGFTSTAANPTVSPTVTTVYSVTETITATGCTNTHSVTVTVNALPAAAAGTDRAICTGTSTTIGSAAVPGSTYAWSSSPAGFSSTSANPTVSPTATTTYILVETITATGCTNTHSVIVTVNALPSVPTITGTASFCAGASTTLTSSASVGYQWNLDGSPISGQTASTLIVTAGGSYTVTITNANGCSATSVATGVTVNPLPTVAAIGGGAAAVCVNALTPAFTDATALGVWSIVPGTGTASITTGGVVTGLTAGTVTVTYTVTNGNGCINFVTASLLINPLPTVGPITGTFTLCSGTTTQLGNETPDGILVSTNPAVATVSNTGLVTALTAGTTTINYTVVNGSGCSTTVSADITVNQTPVVAAITGTLTACVGATTQLADVTAAGTWSSTNTAVATVSAAGLVSGLTPGITTINYTVTIAGCTTIVSANVTVFALPVVAGITGTLDVCVGATTQLLDATPGGETTSRNPAIASVNTTGLVTGVAPGSAIIDYTVTINGCSTIVSATVTVHALPSAVAGTDRAICTGASTTIGAAAVSGSTYAWTSLPAGFTSTAANPTVSPTVTTVYSVTETITATGCTNTHSVTVTVNALPAAAAGTDRAICTGTSTTIGSAAVPGSTYAWSSSPAGFSSTSANPTVSPTAATVYSVTETITATGCINTNTVTVTVNPLPVAAAGASRTICSATPATLGAAAVAGSTYAWTSLPSGFTSTEANPTVSPTVTTVYSVTETITATGCTKTNTVTITVNPLPTVAAIGGGAAAVCVNALTPAFTDATALGVWSIVPGTGTASITTGGVVTGLTAGTVTVTYTVTNGNGCINFVTASLLINPLPTVGPITGTFTLCSGTTTQLGNETPDGILVSTNPAVATVSNTGLVTALTAGTTTINYTVVNGSGCSTTVSADITVNQTPVVAAITGTLTACVGATTQLADVTAAGTWSSTNTAVATVSAAGLVSGLTPGITTINYTVTIAGCTTIVSANVTVFALPVVAGITGTLDVCVGATTQLLDATPGGETTSRNPAIASVNTTGLVTGVAPGSAIIDYTVTINGCSTIVSATVTVHALPSAVAGTDRAICTGASTTIGAAAVSGSTYAWTSLPAGFTSTAANPTVSPTVTTVYSVTETITATGCTNTHSVTVTVNALPAAAAGTDRAICTGTSTTIGSAAVPGSTYAWSSSPAGFSSTSANPTVSPTAATVYSVTETITATGCINTNTVTVTVNPLPVAAAGASRTICSATPATLGAAAVAGSTYAWTSLPSGFTSTEANPTVSPTVTTVYSVTETITATGCTKTNTVTITVNPLPAAVVGSDIVICSGASATIGTVDVPGSVYEWTSLPAGFTSIEANPTVNPVITTTYSLTETITATGCTNTNSITVTVNPLPVAATGSNRTICAGTTTTIGAVAVSGSTYVWTSLPAGFTSTEANPIVGPTVTTTYSLTETITATGCTKTNTVTVTVNPLPAADAGADRAICAGASTTIGAADIPGSTYAWTSSPSGYSSTEANPTVSPTATTTYFLTEIITATGCTKTNTLTVTVNPLPAAAVGPDVAICSGMSTTIGATAFSGSTYIWSSSPAGFASVAAGPSVSPTVTTVYSVTETITATGCTNTNTVTVTVNPLPVAAAGASRTICSATPATLGAAAVAGSTYAWTSLPSGFTSTEANPTVSPTVTTVYSVTETITATGCTKTNTVTITVNPLPTVAAIGGGAAAVCVNALTPAFTDATATGVWSIVPGTGTASVTTGGVVTGLTPGTVSVIYTVTDGNGCINSASASLTVITLPVVGPVTGGAATVCINTTTPAFTNITPGGSWSIEPGTGTAFVTAGGIVVGLTPGTVTVSYAVTNSCGTTTVNTPLTVITGPNVEPLTGTMTICVGTTTQLSNATPGGVTASSNPAVASVNTTGLVTGVSAGTATIYYIVGGVNGCATTVSATITVNPLPAAVAGSSAAICSGTSATIGAAAVAGSTYAWASSPNGFTSTSANPTVSPTVTTIYSLAETITATGCTNTNSVTVTVNPLPAAPTGTASQSFCTSNNSTVADLTATGTAIKWYDAASGGNLLAGSTALTTATHYFASQTITGCESVNRFDVTVTITDPAAPTGTASQNFCAANNPTVADLAATGAGIKWYDAASGGNLLTGSTALTTATHYFASQTISGCESVSRFDLTVTITNPAAPTGTASQSFCAANTPTVANLTATGTALKWYDAASGGNLLTGSTALTAATHYFASQTISGCESVNRLDVTVTITDPAAPTGTASQDFCATNNPTVASLTATGTAIKWYDAASGGNLLTGSTALTTATHYFASQTISGCESVNRLDVTVTIGNTAAPTGIASQSFCAVNNPTIADLIATGTAIKWYDAASGGNLLTGSTTLTTATHYFASQTISGCESVNRFDVTATITDPTAPTGTASQSFCAANNPTIADLTATGTAIKWYDAPSDGNLLTGSTTLTTATHYFASQTITGCESVNRFDVTVTITDPTAPTGTVSQNFCAAGTPTVAGLTATGTAIKWYDAASGGNLLTGSTALTTATHYFASQTISGCESVNRFDVTVTITNSAAPTGTASQSFCPASNSTVADLAATGTAIKWYDAASGGNLLTGSTALTTATHYFASQTISGCESVNRLDVTVTIANTAAPTGTVSQSFCAASNPTVADLAATGTAIKWYDAASGGNLLTGSTALTTATHYFASQTISGCESVNCLDVTVTITNSAAPTGTASQSFCAANNPTVANLIATGTAIKWYDAASGGNLVTGSTALTTATHYFASQTISGCESVNRFDVTVTISNTAAPTGTASQSFCAANNPTVANLTATGIAIKWYDAVSGGNLLTGSTALTTATHYFASQTIAGCESVNRFDVTVTIANTAAPTGTASQNFCAANNPTVANLAATGTAIKWYTAASGGSLLTGSTALITATHYFASQTIAGCESVNRLDVTVTINATPTTPAVTLIQPTCDIATGTITVTAPTGMASYTVTGTSPVTAPVTQAGLTFGGLAPGIYNVTTTSATGCISSALSVTIKLDKAYWAGTIDDDWNKPGNWSTGQVPTGSTHVFIPTGTPPCRIRNADGHAASVQIQSGTTFEVINSWKIIIHGTCATLPAN